MDIFLIHPHPYKKLFNQNLFHSLLNHFHSGGYNKEVVTFCEGKVALIGNNSELRKKLK